MLRRAMLLSLASTIVLACNDSTSPENTVTGTWTLQTVEGKPLPYTLPGTSEVVTAESFTLLASGRFTTTTTFRVIVGGNATTESIPDSGSYVANGATVTFTYASDGSHDTGTVNGNTMTLTGGWVYRRD